MDSNQMRLATIRALKRGSDQLNTLQEHVVLESKQLGFVEESSGRRLTSDLELFREVFWSLTIQGIIYPGLDSLNPNLPFFSITGYGKRVIAQGINTPHDPDGYLAHMRDISPNVDETAMFYVGQSLECFVRGLNTPSAVMLGVATEHLINLLSISLADTIPATQRAKFKQSTANRPIKRVFNEVLKLLEAKKQEMPSGLADGLDHELTGLFALVRKTRNSAGHPTGQEIDQLTALGLLSSFPLLCRQWSELIDWLSGSKN